MAAVLPVFALAGPPSAASPDVPLRPVLTDGVVGSLLAGDETGRMELFSVFPAIDPLFATVVGLLKLGCRWPALLPGVVLL
jgi:hypothetical protein